MAKSSMKLKRSRPAKVSLRAYTAAASAAAPVLAGTACRVCFRELAYKGEIRREEGFLVISQRPG